MSQDLLLTDGDEVSLVFAVLEDLATRREVTQISMKVDSTGPVRSSLCKTVVHDVISIVVVPHPKISDLNQSLVRPRLPCAMDAHLVRTPELIIVAKDRGPDAGVHWLPEVLPTRIRRARPDVPLPLSVFLVGKRHHVIEHVRSAWHLPKPDAVHVEIVLVEQLEAKLENSVVYGLHVDWHSLIREAVVRNCLRHATTARAKELHCSILGFYGYEPDAVVVVSS